MINNMPTTISSYRFDYDNVIGFVIKINGNNYGVLFTADDKEEEILGALRKIGEKISLRQPSVVVTNKASVYHENFTNRVNLWNT